MGRNKVTDVNRIPGFIRNLRRSVDNTAEDMAEDAVRRIDEGFENGHDAMGRPWEPLDPSTVAKKGHGDILIHSGDLRESIDYEIEDNTIQIYSDDEKVIYHERGTSRIPRRPVLEPAGEYMMKNARSDMGDAVDAAFANAQASHGGMAIAMGLESSSGGLLGRVSGGLL